MVVRLILAGLIADFVLQPGSLVAWKKKSIWGLLVHTTVVATVALLVGLEFWSGRYVLLILLLAAAHLIIDSAKIAADRRWTEGLSPLATFLSDQLLHAASIVVLAATFGYIPEPALTSALRLPFADSRYLALASVYIACVLGGSVAVRLVVQSFSAPREADRPGLLKAGAYIGIIERLLITSLVAVNQFGAVGFVLAAKSVARYKEMETTPKFAEYYLIGTLTSSTIGVMGGMLVRAIWAR